MAVRWYSTVIDSTDPRALADWWAAALGWQKVYEADDEVVIVPAHVTDELIRSTPWEQVGPGLIFVRVPEGNGSQERVVATKNSVHFDIRPRTGTRDEEVVLIKAMAPSTDIGQGSDVTWMVLADPEGLPLKDWREIGDWSLHADRRIWPRGGSVWPTLNGVARPKEVAAMLRRGLLVALSVIGGSRVRGRDGARRSAGPALQRVELVLLRRLRFPNRCGVHVQRALHHQDGRHGVTDAPYLLDNYRFENVYTNRCYRRMVHNQRERHEQGPAHRACLRHGRQHRVHEVGQPIVVRDMNGKLIFRRGHLRFRVQIDTLGDPDIENDVEVPWSTAEDPRHQRPAPDTFTGRTSATSPRSDRVVATFSGVSEDKAAKNRLHLDLAPHTSDDRDAEIARLKAMGATEVDVGQGQM